jgi:uncharacterized membrane protein (UPF0182 family)
MVMGFWANLFVEALWFDQLGYSEVFWITIWAKVTIGLVFGAAAFIVIGLNVYLARYFASRLTELHLFNEELSELEQLFSGSRIVDIVTVGGVAVLSAILGLIGLADWDRVLRFMNQEPFGETDPVFGYDISFFVFSLPFWGFVRFWLLLVVAASGIAVVLYYLYRGAVIIEERGMQIRSYARNHVCILGAVILMLVAWGYRLDMFRLLYSEAGFTFGAGYTDLNARLPIYWILLVTALICGGIFIAALFSRRRNLPLLAVGLMIAASLLVGGVFPTLVQQFIVKPNEFEKETPYIQSSIKFTLKGYGLDTVNEVPFQLEQELSAAGVQSNLTTIHNIKLQDKRPLRRTYQQLQEIRTYYDFSNVDEDRYIIDGEYRQVMLAARELSYDQIPSKTWQNEHLVYTHGYGLCLSPVNTATAEGLPHLFVKDIPPVSSSDVLKIARPELYFGETMGNYVVVRTGQKEFDYPEGDQNKFTTYEGTGGVVLSSYFRKLAFARYFDEVNFLISPLITAESQVMFHRPIQERVSNIAPFLQYDHDPYLVIADGKLYWMMDAYTVTGSYPYSQRFPGLTPMQDQEELGGESSGAIPGFNQPPQRRFVRDQPVFRGINYIRNSVKITVDAYTGATRFYIADERDPLIRTYQKIFPVLFRPLAEMPQTLRDHVRYPRDLFAIQAAMYRVYHMEDPQVFYNQEDLWAVPQQLYAGREHQMYPYYAVMKTSKMEKEEMLLLLPFTPSNKENMIGWMAAQCDGANYGRIVVYNFPKQELVYGPMQVEARISQDADIAKELTLWNQEGSEVIRGDLMVMPVESSLLYIEPLYLRQRSSRGGLPELKRVIIAQGNRIAMRETLDQALAAVFSFDEAFALDARTDAENEPPAQAAPNRMAVSDLAQRALTQFTQAQERLRAGDWTGYGNALQQLETTLKRLAEDAGQP